MFKLAAPLCPDATRCIFSERTSTPSLTVKARRLKATLWIVTTSASDKPNWAASSGCSTSQYMMCCLFRGFPIGNDYLDTCPVIPLPGHDDIDDHCASLGVVHACVCLSVVLRLRAVIVRDPPQALDRAKPPRECPKPVQQFVHRSNLRAGRPPGGAIHAANCQRLLFRQCFVSCCHRPQRAPSSSANLVTRRRLKYCGQHGRSPHVPKLTRSHRVSQAPKRSSWARDARRSRSQSIGPPKALDSPKTARELGRPSHD